MAQILPRDMTAIPDGTVNPSAALIVDNIDGVFKATPQNIVDSGAPVNSQAQAEAGSVNTGRMTPLRVAQAIAALGVSQDVLAASGGADLVGTSSGDTVQEVLDASAKTADLAADTGAETIGTIAGSTVQTEIDNRNAIDLSPIMIDLYWGVMRGAGWATGDPGDGASQKGSTFASSAVAGATSVSVASGTFFVDSQLIAFQGTDTFWYTTRISTKSGTTLTLAEPLPAAVSAGGLVGAWFNDYNHPREYGRYAIADYILANLTTKRELVAAQRNWDSWKAYGGSSTVTAIASTAYTHPGANATGLQGANVAASTVGHGAISDPVFLPAGNYEIEVPVNLGNVGAARNTVRLFVEEEFAGSSTSINASVTLVGIDSIQKAVIKVSKAQASRLRIYADGRTAGSFTFQLGAIRWYRVTSQLADLTSGTWVALGDSWFDSPWILDRLEDRMPNVNLVREGVSGDKASDLLTRFDADVTPNNPRVVLVCVGTNDWAAGIDRGVFGTQIQQLIRKCQDIGAQPIFLNCSVGDVATGSQLANSRQYAAALEYEVQNPQDLHDREGVFRGDTLTVANNARVRLFTSSVPVNRAVLVDYASWAASVTGLNICMGFSGSLAPSGSLTDEVAFGSTGYEASKLIINKSDPSSRAYFAIEALNAATGSDQTLTRHTFRVRLADLTK